MAYYALLRRVMVRDLYRMIESGSLKPQIEQALDDLKYSYTYIPLNVWRNVARKIPKDFSDCFIACQALNLAIPVFSVLHMYRKHKNSIQRPEIKYLVIRRMLTERRPDYFLSCVFNQKTILVDFMRWYTIETTCWMEFNEANLFDEGFGMGACFATVSEWLMYHVVVRCNFYETAIRLIENTHVKGKSLRDMLKYLMNKRKYKVLSRMYESKTVRSRVDWASVLTKCSEMNSRAPMPQAGRDFFKTVLAEEPIAKAVRFSTIPDWLEKLLRRTEMFSKLHPAKHIKVPSLQDACRTTILRALSGSSIKERDTAIDTVTKFDVIRSYLKFEFTF